MTHKLVQNSVWGINYQMPREQVEIPKNQREKNQRCREKRTEMGKELAESEENWQRTRVFQK